MCALLVPLISACCSALAALHPLCLPFALPSPRSIYHLLSEHPMFCCVCGSANRLLHLHCTLLFTPVQGSAT